MLFYFRIIDIATELMIYLSNPCIWEKMVQAYLFVNSLWECSKRIDLVWKRGGHRTIIATRLVFSFHEEGEQLPFTFDKYGPSPDEAEAILLQDVVAVLHHLRAEQGHHI